MAKSTSNAKIGLFILVAIVGAAAGFGYFKQTAKLSEAPSDAPKEAAKLEQEILAPKPNDIIIGDKNALVTIVEYSSLSCPHCAEFHEKVLPDVEKEFISTGKAKLVIRYFPLNEAAEKAAETVECAGRNGLKREDFLRTFFRMQKEWAFDDSFLKNLKQIAGIGGLDSASFDSCINDKDLETRILNMRLEAATKLHVSSTPSFFINGVKYVGDPSIEGFRTQIMQAGAGRKP